MSTQKRSHVSRFDIGLTIIFLEEDDMNVEQVMHSGARWVFPDATLSEIAAMMRSDDIGCLPVAENDKLIGMITDRDLAMRAINGEIHADLTAKDIMTRGIIYCRTDQTIEDAVHLMEQNKYGDYLLSMTKSDWSECCR